MAKINIKKKVYQQRRKQRKPSSAIDYQYHKNDKCKYEQRSITSKSSVIDKIDKRTILKVYIIVITKQVII